jgi:hypothetical protein
VTIDGAGPQCGDDNTGSLKHSFTLRAVEMLNSSLLQSSRIIEDDRLAFLRCAIRAYAKFILFYAPLLPLDHLQEQQPSDSIYMFEVSKTPYRQPYRRNTP